VLYDRQLTVPKEIQTMVMLRLHPSAASLMDSTDLNGTKIEEQIEKVLNNIAAQTGLTLKTTHSTQEFQTLTVKP
jgi:hypothetical protein